MISIETAATELAVLFKKSGADYIEARLEEGRSSNISYRGRELESVGRSIVSGGNLRALVKGGWGFVSFDSLDDLPSKVQTVVSQARFVGKEKSNLAPIPVTHESVLRNDTGSVDLPLARKKALCDRYNDIIWQTPSIQTSNVGFGDGFRKTLFMNSEGTRIIQDRADCTLRVNAIAAKDGEVEQVGLSMGSTGDISQLENLDVQVKDMAQHAVGLLSAPRAKGGEYTVVLDPILAGVFVHEAFGHLSESDFVYENDRMKDIMVLGKVFGSKELNIVDTATLPGLRGSFKYDDEGTPAVKTYIIKEGTLVGRLHSRETAAKMGEKPTGNARAINYRFPPIVRMTNTYIEPRKMSFQEIIADVKEGIYVKNWYGGQTSMEMFTFASGEAYMIRNGRVEEAIKPVQLTGDLFTTLKNIDAIGNDLDMNQGGGCGKGGQSPLPVSNGSPHIRIQKCLVGGR